MTTCCYVSFKYIFPNEKFMEIMVNSHALLRKSTDVLNILPSFPQ